MVKSASGKDGYRSFTVVEVGKHGGCKTKFNAGRYINKTPAGAARKAFSEHCRIKKIRGVCTLVVSVKETTKDSKGKVFSYKLHRRKLKEPLIRLEGTPSEYVIEYKTDAKSVEVPIACRNKGQTVGRKAKRTKRKIRISPNNVRKLRERRAKKSLKNTIKNVTNKLFSLGGPKNNKNNGKKTVRRSARIAAKKSKNNKKNGNNNSAKNVRRSPRLAGKKRVRYN